MRVVMGLARLASVDQELDDGVLARARQASDGTDGVALTQQVEDLRTVRGMKLSDSSLITDLMLERQAASVNLETAARIASRWRDMTSFTSSLAAASGEDGLARSIQLSKALVSLDS
jgi:hypothetical protein